MDLYQYLGETESSLVALEQRKLNYIRFPLRKKSGGIRWIHTPSAELKAVQHKINDKILNHPINVQRIPVCATAYKRGGSPLVNAKIHANSSNLMVIDLKDFFPNIDQGRVELQMTKLLKDLVDGGVISEIKYADIKLLSALCCHNGHLVQGAPTSPQLSNYIMSFFDKAIFRFARMKGLRYSRYSDDLIFSVSKFSTRKKVNLSLVYDSVATSLTRKGFLINRKKVRLLCSNRQLRVTGIVVNDRPNLDKKSYKILRAKVHNTVQLNKSTGHVPSKKFMEELRGEIGWLISINSKKGYQLLNKLNTVVALKKSYVGPWS